MQPLILGEKDNERAVLVPAIEGTKSILNEAKKHPRVKRIVLTSSIVAILDPGRPSDGEVTLTSRDWAPVTYKEAKEAGNNDRMIQWAYVYLQSLL